MIAGQALSFTPDYLSAKVAAGRLFKLFDTESKIDVNQPGGKIKVIILRKCFGFVCMILFVTAMDS